MKSSQNVIVSSSPYERIPAVKSKYLGWIYCDANQWSSFSEKDGVEQSLKLALNVTLSWEILENIRLKRNSYKKYFIYLYEPLTDAEITAIRLVINIDSIYTMRPSDGDALEFTSLLVKFYESFSGYEIPFDMFFMIRFREVLKRYSTSIKNETPSETAERLDQFRKTLSALRRQHKELFGMGFKQKS